MIETKVNLNINKNITQEQFDEAISNGTIGENDLTFISDEGISASDVNGIGKDGQPTTQDVINLQKQNNLIAGENIFIEEDVISAKIIPVYVGAEGGSIVMNTNTIRLLGEQSVITLNLNPPIDTTIKNSISIEFYSGETPTVFNISEDIQMKDLIPESNKTYEIDFWYRTNKTDSDWRWVGIWKEFEEAN